MKMKTHSRTPKRLFHIFILSVLGLKTLQGSFAHAIYTRHDIESSHYIVEDSNYPALVDLPTKGECLGTLVHNSYLLTAAHCTTSLKAGQFLLINGVSHSIAKPIPHPDWDPEYDEHDIALIPLHKPVEGVTPIPIYRGQNELGSTITIVGRGDHATGLEGANKSTTDGKLRRATNRVSNIDEHFLEITFEHADEKGVTDLEGIGGDGDSGGPSFIDVDSTPHIAGVNAWGEGNSDKDIVIGQYGAKDYQIRVSQYTDWIDQTLQP